MTTGERIKAAREKAGMTQVELGKKIGVSGVAIMRYEKGTRQPRLGQLYSLAEALNIGILEFIDPCSDPYIAILVRQGYNWTETERRLIRSFVKLNNEGQDKAVERVEELTEIPRYRIEIAPQSTPAPKETDSASTQDVPEKPPEGE